MKKLIKVFYLIATTLLLKSTSNAQEVFDTKPDSWTMGPSVINDKIGVLYFALNNVDNPYIGLAVTPVVAGISQDSSLALINLHSSAVKIKTITSSGDTLVTILEPGDYKKIISKDWGKTDKIFLFQEIVDAYEGTLFCVPKYLANEEDTRFVELINRGFLPHWNKSLEICNLKLIKNGPGEIKFEFNVTGGGVLDKCVAIGLEGIYLSYASTFASGKAKINYLKSNAPADSVMSFSVIKSNQATESNFVLKISPIEFEKVLKITKGKNGFHAAFYSSHDVGRDRVKGLSNWWIKNNIGKHF